MLASDLQRLLSAAAALLPRGDGESARDGSPPTPSGRGLARLISLCDKYLELYGDGRVELLRAPARINILGEHVDYVSYLPTCSLPFGSREHDMLMLYGPAETGRVRGASLQEDYAPFDFDLGESHPGTGGGAFEHEWVARLFEEPPPTPGWGNYVKGSCFFARMKFGARAARGYDFVVDSSIPPKGGASSSSALTVLAGAAFRRANLMGSEPAELAFDSSLAEWYVGTRGGSMDHLTICLAEGGRAVRIAYRERSTRLLPLPCGGLRWVTFFTHPADKGREVMLAYNERAAVSRLLIPAIIEEWGASDPARHERWRRAVGALAAGDEGAAREVRALLEGLPEAVTLGEFERDYADAYRECAGAFHALAAEPRGRALRVRDYALHHLGEILRVSAAERLLDARPDPHAESGGRRRPDLESCVERMGSLLRESHESLRDLYGVSTPEVESLVETVLADPNVYGARLMGGGFGGNVLALTSEENLPSLTRRVQEEFYAPRGRDGAGEGSLMVSTPGDGLSRLDLGSVWREAVEQLSALGPDAESHRPVLCELLDQAEGAAAEVWPVIVAAGKGSRARRTGLDAPKPVAGVSGAAAVLRVLRSVREGCGAAARTPVVVVSAETEAAVREALAGEEVIYVTQTEPLGTGDAVWRAREVLADFGGRALVVWGTQPVVRPRTVARALRLAALFDECEMALPTALKAGPYAPVERDARGRVAASRETHLEGAPRPAFGETNVGLFVLKSRAMFDALAELRRLYWRESERRYERRGGELGFPNEMIGHFAARGAGVAACPFADPREEQGIKTLEDVARCERFIAELEGEEA